MKKHLSLIIILLLLSANLFAQTVLFSDDFESYITTQKLAEQSSATEWTTWSGSTGGSEDATITTEQAFSAPNSAKIITNNDLVLDLGGKTTRRYQVKFQLYVENEKGAFFGFMQSFDGRNTEFGLSASFLLGNTGSVSVAGKEFEFDYKFDTWMQIIVIIDLDDDFATMLIDGDEIVSWPWSGGSQDLLKLDGIDFWGYDDENGCSYYLDDVEYNQLDSYNGPTNLITSLTGDDVSLSWDSSADTPDAYGIFRDNVLVGETTNNTNNTFDDMDVYLGTYDYTVRAMYGEYGYSEASNTETETISGGVERELVLYEIGTGTWCPYCPGASMGAHDLIENNLDVAIVKYHSGDSYEFTEGKARLNYYRVSSYPTSKADGILTYGGGSSTQSLYSVYKPFYDKRINVPSTHSIEMEISKVDDTNYKLTFTVTEEYKYFADNLVLITALTESNIAESWQGQSSVDYASRGVYPNASGTALDFSSSATQEIILDFTVDQSWALENCELVAFVQYNTTKEIVQAVKAEFPPVVSVSVEDGAANVNLDEDLVFTFSEPIRHLTDETIEGLDSMIIFKKNDANGEDFAFEVAINESLNEITISHDSLDQNTTYYVELSSYIESFNNLRVIGSLSTTFTTESMTSIAEPEIIKDVEVYPNPFKDNLNLVYHSKETGYSIIEIYNQSGVLVKSKKQVISSGEQFVEINTEEMANGIYFLNLKVNNNRISKKIVLLR